MTEPEAKTEDKKTDAKSTLKKKKREDFRFGPTLGEGSYSTVVLACEIATGHEFAMKILEKRHIIKENKVPQVIFVFVPPLFISGYQTSFDMRTCLLCK